MAQLVECYRLNSEAGRFTMVYLRAPLDADQVAKVHSPLLELKYNWVTEHYEGGRNFGHLAFEVDDIYQTCKKLMAAGVVINRPPRDGRMAFIRSPDKISIELLQQGVPLTLAEPWLSMENTGELVSSVKSK
jgi:lactoylglutathione lyase